MDEQLNLFNEIEDIHAHPDSQKEVRQKTKKKSILTKGQDIFKAICEKREIS